ncbi:acyl-CoA dehydrogenase family protein [Hydrocarboniphaga sp.]|uniref:acyl-CoA dehydrogenase family protein n=1 Tax=Hydrocarboniphaga sp. TaxID=2033016 RepID=UPI003D0FE314
MQADTRYHPNADQLALASAMDDTINELLPLSRLHVANDESPEVWSHLEQAGVFGICVSEAEGGSALGAAEEALIAIGLGRRLASPAVLATLGAAHSGLSGLGGKRVAAGYRRGERVVVVDSPGAEWLLLREADGAALYALEGLQTRALDQRLWVANLHEGAGLGAAVASFDAAGLLRLRLLDAALLAGIADAALQMGVAYAGLREQFGRPIGTFQAVKHHCANMAIAARCARDQVSFASVAIDEGREDAILQTECAVFVAGDAALGNAGKNIQIHGGIGFSDEADPHLLVKRAQVLIAYAGGLEAANARIANIKTER